MNFRRRLDGDEPEINLIPLIDVLLVILIFLAVTTSFTRLNQLDINLPQAQADAIENAAITIAISRDGLYAINGRLLPGRSVEEITRALRIAAHNTQKPVLVINADALSTHEAVVQVMQAAQRAGIGRINFATESPP